MPVITEWKSDQSRWRNASLQCHQDKNSQGFREAVWGGGTECLRCCHLGPKGNKSPPPNRILTFLVSSTVFLMDSMETILNKFVFRHFLVISWCSLEGRLWNCGRLEKRGHGRQVFGVVAQSHSWPQSLSTSSVTTREGSPTLLLSQPLPS